MKIINENFKGGWFIGDFDPTAFNTKDFEVSYKIHKQNEIWPAHYHKIATEINYLIKGTMIIQGKTLIAGNVFIIYPYEIADPIFIEDCEMIVVKIPSTNEDKFNI